MPAGRTDSAIPPGRNRGDETMTRQQAGKRLATLRCAERMAAVARELEAIRARRVVGRIPVRVLRERMAQGKAVA